MKDKKTLHVDWCVIQDHASASALLERREKPAVRTVIIIDQTVPPNSPEVSELQKRLMERADRDEIPLFYGRGVSAHLICRELAKEGQVVVSCDPTVTAAGAVGALGFCVSAEKMAEILSSGELVMEVPDEMVLTLGAAEKREENSQKLALSILKSAGADNLKGKAVRISEKEPGGLTEDQKISIGAILGKAGAASVDFPGQGEDKEQEEALEIQENGTKSLAALPGGFAVICPTDEIPQETVNGVFIGGAAGGALEEIALAASLLKGRKVAYGVRLIVSPATAETYIRCADQGYITDIMEAGGLVINQCGTPEVQGRIGKNEVMISNDVENGRGYAGFETSKIYLTDTAAAVQAALSGVFGSKKEQQSQEEAESRSLMFEGRCWKFGDDIDTDIIIPTQHLSYETMEEIKVHAFEPLRPELSALLREGDLIVAGNNFGCGSSREQAAEVIAACGVHCIIAKSFARIFFRNAMNNGILLLECEELSDQVEEGDVIQVDLSRQQVTANGKSYSIPAVPENLYRIIMEGGLVKSIEKKVRNQQMQGGGLK